MNIRHTVPSDHARIISVIKDWWDGRDLTSFVPKIFLIHFCDTSYIAEDNGEMIAFLIGFFSQSIEDQGYIHFAGVHPEFRKQGIASGLYNRFFKKCAENGRYIIQSCTSPVNTKSIAFHKKMGFEILKGDGIIDGIDVALNYNKPDDAKVLFKKILPLSQDEQNLIFRKATSKDASLLSGIISKSYQDVALRFNLTKDNCPKHPSNCQIKWVETDLARLVIYYILYHGDIPLGCAALESAGTETCYLERLAVLPQYRNKGYGKKLVNHVFTKAREQKKQTLSIGIIAEQNDLKQWYENLGFIETDNKKFSHLPFDVTFLAYDLKTVE